jgi:glycosyltransferase involved in cell wall biosynthesis
LENDGLAIIIPAYNESITIQNVIISVIKYADVIVVDDGSTDDTARLAKLVGAKVISQKNEGYDSALSKGFEYARNLNYKYLITLDADGEHDTNNLEDFIKRLKLGHDVVVGIRKEKRRISEKIFGYLTVIKYGIFDPLCGLKGYSINVYKLIPIIYLIKCTV